MKHAIQKAKELTSQPTVDETTQDEDEEDNIKVFRLRKRLEAQKARIGFLDMKDNLKRTREAHSNRIWDQNRKFKKAL